MIPKKRIGIILLSVMLMFSFVIIIELSWEESQHEASLEEVAKSAEAHLPVEEGVFRRSSMAMDYSSMPENDAQSQRTLDKLQKNRAYPGAPPTIPHEILSGHDMNIGGKSCLQCHENGGYVDKFKAYTPVTPHPELINCRQCHVPQSDDALFKQTNWEKPKATAIHNSALQGSPPVIPHSLQLRENCLACHAGPAAPKEIRVSHPERINCRQCHALGNGIIEGLTDWESSLNTNP